MIRIAIVEDDISYSCQFQKYIHKYSKESKELFDVSVFSDGNDIVWNYNSNYDIIFMDVQMQKLDGMSAARSIRKVDTNVVIIFITNMAQYAIQGYEVDAMNYILKPVNYFAFSQQLAKAVKQAKARMNFYINILHESSMVRLDVTRISYIESCLLYTARRAVRRWRRWCGWLPIWASGILPYTGSPRRTGSGRRRKWAR